MVLVLLLILNVPIMTAADNSLECFSIVFFLRKNKI